MRGNPDPRQFEPAPREVRITLEYLILVRPFLEHGGDELHWNAGALEHRLAAHDGRVLALHAMNVGLGLVEVANPCRKLTTRFAHVDDHQVVRFDLLRRRMRREFVEEAL